MLTFVCDLWKLELLAKFEASQLRFSGKLSE